MKKTAFFITSAAIIAALYVVLTLLISLIPGFANMAIQVRVSEALTILPLFTPAAIPGLFLGCLISNILLGSVPLDIICGSLTTLLAAVITYFIGRALCKAIHNSENKSGKRILGIVGTILGSLPPVIGNMFVVPLVLIYGYQIEGLYWFFVLTVGIGELISCTIIGLLLSFVMRKTGLDIKLNPAGNLKK